MNRLLLSAATLAMLAAPTLAEARKAAPAPAKHKVVKAKKTATVVETKTK